MLTSDSESETEFDSEFHSFSNLSLIVVPDEMVNNEAKLKKLYFARKRLLSDLKHAIASAKELTRVSKALLILSKDKTIDRYWDEFQVNLAEIISLTDAMADEEAFFTENQAIEDEYHAAKVHLDDVLPNDDGDATINRTFAGFANNGGNYTHGTEKKSHRSHLPDIKFQPFDGNYDNWNRFSQMFSKMVVKEKLDAIDKLYYLNQALIGEPLQLIKHMPIDNDSFNKAWALLTKTYEVRRHIVSAQFNRFFSIKKMKHENATELREMLRICMECESAFDALNIDANTIGLMMTHYCALQMDAETSRQWETELKNHNEEPKLSEPDAVYSISSKRIQNRSYHQLQRSIKNRLKSSHFSVRAPKVQNTLASCAATITEHTNVQSYSTRRSKHA